MPIKIDDFASNKIKSEMKLRNIKAKEICKKLQEVGESLSEQSFNNKLFRANFSSTFFFKCMYVLGVEKIDFELKNITNYKGMSNEKN